MNTILIIENEVVELASLIGIFKKWREDIEILTAHTVQAAIDILSGQQVDLVVCDLSLSKNNSFNDLHRLTYAYPYVPCLAIVQKGAVDSKQQGISYCLDRPFSPDQLLQHTEELLKIATSGTMENVATHNLLQMLESEEKTCTLRVLSKKDSGLLYMQNGSVIGAETGKLKNESALYSILAWEDVITEIKHFNSQRQREIHTPLISLILETFRLKDERDSLKLKKKNEQPKLQFKHISTIDNPISFNIRTRLKMEFINPKTTLMCMMVGMLQDKYLIVTTPSPFQIIQDTINSGERIVVKYIHMGKLFMFKTTLLKAIDDPHHLLFLSYPSVVHHHEFRRSQRTTVFVPCTLQLSEGAKHRGALLDMSSNGGLFQISTKGNQTLHDVELDDQVQLRCLLPGFNDEQDISGFVRNIQKDHTETRIGIEFMELQHSVLEKIEDYLSAVNMLSN